MSSEPRIPEGPVRIVLVGAGAMGQAWARALHRHPRCRLAAIVDSDLRRARGLALRLRLPELPVSATLESLPGPAADACVNATPPQVHLSVITQALTSGLSVLTEKPFAMDLDQAVELTGTAARHGRLLMVGQSRSFQPGVDAFRAAIDRLGGLDRLEARFSRGYPAEGFRAELDQPLLRDMAVHAFDTARKLTGSDAASVYCDAPARPHTGYRGPAEATALFTMLDGSRFLYRGSWCAPAMPTAWSGSWRATGLHGTATWTGTGTVRLALAGGAAVASGETGADHGPAPDEAGTIVARVDDQGFDLDPVRQVAAPLEEFLDALATGAPGWGSARNNLATMAMLDAAIASARSGLPGAVAPGLARLSDGWGD
ncbi:putative dehydrogenase [Kitasatospora sp. GP30]|uniref:Gfo/Idh/MocA family protein n=1 Tax=Kitasatospora sp. GP30 TaxID=3035084 RepID=UPI000CA9D4E7|nr:Gfo/Idh/MocA family oxidoreductase [Kitasatospora sp. GP30]MDH6145155.1 putative dehydrogenase [Kitasatospora sp. GP30]